ncbi:MAG: Nif11-like leader peptide family natural product precursor [Clostridia bacterium]|nr:Nif11-like leader peptide family natural product precursor [Clostridia bacterium]
MSENLKKFLELISENRELAEQISAEKDPQAIIAKAAELGVELTEADLAKPAEELSDDELATVAGGGDVSCACAMGGGGTKDGNDKTCACVLAGAGYSKQGRERCVCGFAGYGYDT